MKKNLLSLALSAVALFSTQTGFAGGNSNEPKKEDVLNYELKCNAGMTQCIKTTSIIVPPPASVNAVGDKVSLNVAGVAQENLGSISENKTIDLVMPSSGFKIYSFVPSQGSRLVAGKPVRLLFAAYDLNQAFPAGTNAKVIAEGNAGKAASSDRSTMLKIYTQKGDETQWTELFTYFAPQKDLSKLDALKATISPNGDVSVPSFLGQPIKAILGKIS